MREPLFNAVMWLVIAFLLFIIDTDSVYELSAFICAQIWIAVLYIEKKMDEKL